MGISTYMKASVVVKLPKKVRIFQERWLVSHEKKNALLT